MIKVGTFLFDEYETKDHWADFAKFGRVSKYTVEYYKEVDEVPLRLNSEQVYQLSLDQSSTNTGIFIKSYDNTEAYMVEKKRATDENADDYMFGLERLIHQICDGATFTHLVYERPIITESFRSSQVLFQLEGYIRSWNKRYKEFANARLEFIESSSWRRVVILDHWKGMTGKQQKIASRNSIGEIFDWTNLYGNSINSDEDVFESIGVMFGWFINSYDTLGRPYVRGDIYNGSIGGFIMPCYGSKEVSDMFQEAGLKAEWYMQNPRKSTFENIASAVEKYKIVCVELTDKFSMLALSVECGMKWMDPDVMTVVLVAANYVDNRLFKITGNEYHFVI